jgi:PAS domain S-box-containing protein
MEGTHALATPQVGQAAASDDAPAARTAELLATVAAVRQSEAAYRALVEHLPAVTYLVALDGSSTLYVSPQIERLLGFTPDEWVADPRRWVRQIHPDDRARVLAELGAGHAGSGRFSAEYRLLTAGGDVVWVRDEASVRLDAAGRPLCTQGIWLDITATKEAAIARDQLRRERAARAAAVRRSARLRALHEAALALAAPLPGGTVAPAAVAALLAQIVSRAQAALDAADGALVLVPDPAWNDLVSTAQAGRPSPAASAAATNSPEVAGVEGAAGADPDSAGAIRLLHDGRLSRQPVRAGGATAHALASGEPVIVADTRAPSPFGPYPRLAERGVLSFAIVPLHTAARVVGTLSVNFPRAGAPPEEDVEALALFAAHAAAALERVRLAQAERRLTLQGAELARREAEAAALRELDQLKDELLATISHELRTPLTVAHAYAQRLAARARTLSPAAVEASAARILAGTTQVTRLVLDLVEFGRAERGELVVEPAAFDLAALLGELLTEFHQRTGGARLVSEFPSPLAVHADRARVTQVVANLVENALKYAPDGPVIVRATPAAGVVRVEVQDQGPGISRREQARVWEKFYRGRRIVKDNLAGGTGIGLAVVKALVEAQGGRVGLDSSLGQGATFWFELPAATT